MENHTALRIHARSLGNMAKHDRFEQVHTAIDARLENLQKWYRKVDDTDAYFISLGPSLFVHLDSY